MTTHDFGTTLAALRREPLTDHAYDTRGAHPVGPPLAYPTGRATLRRPEGDPRLEPATATSATTGAPGDARHQGGGRPGCGGSEPVG